MLDKYYNQIYYSASNSNDTKEDKKLSKIFEEDIPTNKLILDVGCGPGVTLASSTKNNKIFGLDIITKYLDIANKNGYYGTIKCNIENGLPFSSYTFDIVVCTDLIEHIFDTEFVGREIHRVLKDDGYVIFNVPNHNVLTQRLRFLLGKGVNMHNIDDWKYFHIRFFTWKSWQLYLKMLGFKIVSFYVVPVYIYPIRLHIPIVLAKNLPNLFSYRFLVKVIKKMKE